MAARRAQIAGREATTSPSSAIAPASSPASRLADPRILNEHRAKLIAFIRAMARDTARADHAAKFGEV